MVAWALGVSRVVGIVSNSDNVVLESLPPASSVGHLNVSDESLLSEFHLPPGVGCATISGVGDTVVWLSCGLASFQYSSINGIISSPLVSIGAALGGPASLGKVCGATEGLNLTEGQDASADHLDTQELASQVAVDQLISVVVAWALRILDEVWVVSNSDHVVSESIFVFMSSMDLNQGDAFSHWEFDFPPRVVSVTVMSVGHTVDGFVFMLITFFVDSSINGFLSSGVSLPGGALGGIASSEHVDYGVDLNLTEHDDSPSAWDVNTHVFSREIAGNRSLTSVPEAWALRVLKVVNVVSHSHHIVGESFSS